jgi:hypothetical protein
MVVFVYECLNVSNLLAVILPVALRRVENRLVAAPHGVADLCVAGFGVRMLGSIQRFSGIDFGSWALVLRGA